jgi:hypothetical protein
LFPGERAVSGEIVDGEAIGPYSNLLMDPVVVERVR